MPAIPPEIQLAANAAIIPLMAKLKIRGPIVVTVDPPPAPPAGLTLTPSLTGIALKWTANTESDLAATPYHVYRSTDGVTFALIAGPLAGVTYADATAHAGTLYTFQVTATDLGGNESTPAAISGTRPAVPTPTNLTAVRAPLPSGNVLLSWTASTDPAHAAYTLKRSDDGGATFPTTITTSGTTATDGAATPNVLLTYRLTDTNTNGDVSAPVVVTITVDTAAPNPLANLRVTSVTASSISIAWDASTAPDLKALPYIVERSTAGGAFTVLTAGQAGTTYTDTTAAPGFPYAYRVTAVDNSNNVSAPATIAASIPSPPPAPTNLTATATTGGIALAWTPVSGSTGYRVYSSASLTGTFTLIGSPTAASYNDTAAATGTTTYYQVRAVDALGQLGTIASVSAVRPAAGGTQFFTVGVGTRAQTAATVIAAPLGHATHFNALALVGAGDWRVKRFIWNFGEAGTQHVTDWRTTASVDLNTAFNLSNPCVAFTYTLAGQKNVTLTIVNEDGTTLGTYAVVVDVPPAGRTVIPVGSSQTLKTLADVNAHMADNTEFVFDAGTYTTATDVPMRHRNVVLRAATNGTVTIKATKGAYFPASGAAPTHSMWPGQTFDATFVGITWDSEYTAAQTQVTAPSTPLAYKSGCAFVTNARGENVGFVDCRIAVMNEGWKSTVDVAGYSLLRCSGTDPVGVAGRTIWLEGSDVAVVGCVGLNSINESTIRNANTLTSRILVDFGKFSQVLDPAHGRGLAKAAGTFRYWNMLTVQRCLITDADWTFDPLGATNVDSYGVVDANYITNGILQVDGNVTGCIFRNNVVDNRASNKPCVNLFVKSGPPVMPLLAHHVINNTLLGAFPTQPGIVVQSYNTLASPPAQRGTVLANNLYLNPALVPTPGRDGAAVTLYSNDRTAYDAITGNVLPDVLDSAGSKQLVTVKGNGVTANGLLTLAQWNAYTAGVDRQENTTIDANFAPAANSLAATSGVSLPGVFRVPLTDYYGQASAPGRVGAVNPQLPVPAPNYSDSNPYPWVVGPDGWTVPFAPLHAYYIDGTAGDDTAAGTINAPWKTTKPALKVLAPGDAIYFKNGSTNPPFTGFVTKPYVIIGRYGAPGARPIIDCTGGGTAIHFASTAFNCFIFGLDVPGDHQHSKAFVFDAQTNGCRVEGCSATGHYQAINTASNRSPSIRRCNLSRNYQLSISGQNTAQGIYIYASDSILLEDCTINYNGWDGTDPTQADEHPHGIYDNDIDNPPPFYPLTVRNCVVAENGANGVMGRNPTVADNCLFVDNGIHGSGVLCGGPYSEVKNCVFTGAADAPARSTPRGYGVSIGAQSADVHDNLFIHSGGVVAPAIQIGILISNKLDLSQGTVRIWNNKVIDWNGIGIIFDNLRGSVELTNNVVSTTGGNWLVNYRSPPVAPLKSSGNSWLAGGVYRILAAQNYNLAQWTALAHETGSNGTAQTTWSASIEGYAASVGMASCEAFLARCEANGPDNWDERFAAKAFNDYARAGH